MQQLKNLVYALKRHLEFPVDARTKVRKNGVEKIFSRKCIQQEMTEKLVQYPMQTFTDREFFLIKFLGCQFARKVFAEDILFV